MSSVAERLPEEFAAALAATVAERGVFGARLHYAAEVGSTNDLASAAADRGEPEGTTFVAGAQTAGRGRLGRTWFSPPDAGLYLSTIVRRAAAGAVDHAGRWRGGGRRHPRRDGAAAADQVAERHRRGRRRGVSRAPQDRGDPRRRPRPVPTGVSHVVLGIGINLRPAAFPPELADRASAIETELGRPVDAGAGARAGARGAEPHARRAANGRSAGARRAVAGAVAVGARRADRMGRRLGADRRARRRRRPAGPERDGLTGSSRAKYAGCRSRSSSIRFPGWASPRALLLAEPEPRRRACDPCAAPASRSTGRDTNSCC